MWVAITIVLVKILSLYPSVALMLAPLSLISVAFTAIMYVDDTDLFIVGSSNKESLSSVYTRALFLVGLWWRSIWATGGPLRPDKCFWYLIGFRWHGSKWSYITKDDDGSTISIPSLAGDDDAMQIKFILSVSKISKLTPHTGPCLRTFRYIFDIWFCKIHLRKNHW